MPQRRFIASQAAALCAALALLGAGTASAQPADPTGQSIASLVDALRDRGFAIIYSSDVLPDSLRVARAPEAAAPLDRLREVLAPHGLALEPGPRGSWLIVRDVDGGGPAPAPEGFTAPRAVPAPPDLENVVVSASRYAFARDTSTSSRTLDRRLLENAPTLGEDALRATQGLPGVSSGGLSAEVNVRGGETNEALVLLDGVELYDPYHLKDFQSVFSSIDPRTLASMVVQTGGYPAEFGGRMSGVIEMQSVTPAERHFEIGLSTLTSSVLGGGRFAGERGDWLVSVRRGNLDLLVDASQSDVGQPQYTDAYARLGYALGDDLSIGGGLLQINDETTLRDPGVVEASADDHDNYFWLGLEHGAGDFEGRYLLTAVRLTAERAGRIDDPTVSFGALSDERELDGLTLKGDWSYDFSERHRLLWGAELARAEASYRFESAAVFPVPIVVAGFARPDPNVSAAVDLDRTRQAAYVSYRRRLLDRLTAELGLRHDAQSEPDDTQLSPRLALMLDVGDRATLRGSWGRFFQPQRLDELQISSGVTTLFPAQEAEHTVVGFDYLLGASMSLRLEAYRKTFARLRPRFENLYARVSLLPELLPDRIEIAPLSGEADGLEISLDGETERWRWWVGLARASFDDTLATGTVRRSWDEPWSLKGGADWNGARWDVSVAAIARSGRPISDLDLVGGELVAGPFNAERFPAYRTFDVRASRTFAFERGALDVFVELTNALNRGNPCCVSYEVELDGPRPDELDVETSNWLPLVPSIGLLWQF